MRGRDAGCQEGRVSFSQAVCFVPTTTRTGTLWSRRRGSRNPARQREGANTRRRDPVYRCVEPCAQERSKTKRLTRTERSPPPPTADRAVVRQVEDQNSQVGCRWPARSAISSALWTESLSLRHCKLFQSEDLRRYRLIGEVHIAVAPLTGLSCARQAAVTPRTKQSRRRTPEPVQSGRRTLSGGAPVTTTPRHSYLALMVMTAR